MKSRIQSVPLDKLVAHPDSPNKMSSSGAKGTEPSSPVISKFALMQRDLDDARQAPRHRQDDHQVVAFRGLGVVEGEDDIQRYEDNYGRT